MTIRKRAPRSVPTSWDPVARWYDGWVGAEGSKHHRVLAIPALLDLLAPQPNETILDIGAGQGVLAPYIIRSGASYVGIDASPHLLRLARQRHGRRARFIEADARDLRVQPKLLAASFDAAVFLLSIQDMDPLDQVIDGAAWALKPGGRVVLLMTHPCFRVPRQSGWGWDARRKLQFRRVDRYLSPLPVPMKAYHRQGDGATRSFHRPLSAYINGLAEHGLLIDRLDEIAADALYRERARSTAEATALHEFPLFVAIRAWKVAP